MLTYKKRNVYAEADEEKLGKIFAYAEGYKAFMNAGKTERECVSYLVKKAEEAGFTPYVLGEKLNPGDKKYYNNRGKNVYFMRIGTKNPEKDGVRVMAAHIDSPRVDLKQNPLYEAAEQAMFKTHYYGGIKKYQWTAIPLSIHGKMILSDGSAKEVNIGEDEGDPVFYISDLLPHLAYKQIEKKLSEGIEGEELNIWAGSIPEKGEKENAVKLHILKLLNEKYGMCEEDFLSADLCAVPAMKAKDVGFDRALIAAYGHDDRSCAYTAFTSVLEAKETDHTVIVALADKEEVGSDSVTGMTCQIMEDLIDAICASFNANPAAARANSMCLSADVSAAYDETFSNVFEKNNASLLSYGTTLMKFTGARGKSGSNDATVDLVGKVRKLFNDNGVYWQMAELGKVDIGGGGTVAKFIAKMNIDTVDIGVPVISMHAPYELISKADLYETAMAFNAFCRN